MNIATPFKTAPALPAPSLLAMHDVTIVTTRKFAQARVLGVPPEEFGIERGARSIRDCNYCFHEVATKSEAQLIAEGFDMVEEDVDKERFFAFTRHSYWESPQASPRRALMETLIGKLDF